MATPVQIAMCARCSQLPQRLDLDYEKSETVRPPALAALEIVRTERRDDPDSREVWSETTVMRCPVCTTAYFVSRSQDTGHSFMDPTHDSERVVRLTPEAARKLGLEVTSTGDLESENWHIRQYAIESRIDAWDSIDELLAHPHMPVRVEAAYDVIYLVKFAQSWWVHRVVTPAAHERARGLAEKAVAAAVDVLRAPSEPTIYFMQLAGDYLERPTTTHRRAAETIDNAVRSDLSFNDIELLLEMLRSEEAVMFHANSALMKLTRERPEIVGRVRVALTALPRSVREDYNVRRLVEQTKI